MSRDDNRIAFLALPSQKLVSSIAVQIAKQNKRLAKQEKNDMKIYKSAIRRSKKEALSTAALSQNENKSLLSNLPCSSLYPVNTDRERLLKQRAKTAKRSRKQRSKRLAAAKSKAARLERMQQTRAWTKNKAMLAAKEATLKAEREKAAADRAAFIAAKEAEPQKVTFVDQVDHVKAMVDEVMALSSPALYLDAEGINLSRDGELILLQMYVDTDTGPHTYVVDVWALKTEGAFHTPGSTNPETTFKCLLEDPSIPKLFWDCRMDSDALYAQHDISLAGVLDIQLMEVAQRPYGSMYRVRGYAPSVKYDAGLDWYDREKMEKAKGAKILFIPRLGGSWDVLKARPIRPELLDYCAGDVRYMPKLVDRYSKALLVIDRAVDLPVDKSARLDKPADYFADHGYDWTSRVVAESAARIARSQGQGWSGDRDVMTKSPWADEGWDYLDHYDY